MQKGNFIRGICLGFILLLMVPALSLAAGHGPNTVFAAAGSGENVVVETSETVKGPGFYSGNSVQIDGTVDGTTFLAGRRIVVNGQINGDLFVAGQELTINGKVRGNLFVAGQSVKVNGQIIGDVFGAGQDLEISKDAVIQRDALVTAGKVLHLGKIKRQLFASGQVISINGFTKDDIKVAADRLEVLENAVIAGNLAYASPNQGVFSDKAQIKGEPQWTKVETKYEGRKKESSANYFWIITGIMGALVIWFIIMVWRPGFWQETSRIILKEPWKTAGVGALTLFLAPVACIIAMVTIIGLPLGIILALAYGVSIYLSKIIVAVLIGCWLAGRFSWPEKHKGVWLVLLGLVILAAITRIPIVGFLVQLTVLFAGLGSLVLTLAKPGAKEL